MKIKVCGMRDPLNIAAAARLKPDYMGFVFYPPSPRYAGEMPEEALASLPAGVCRTGVFVDAAYDEIVASVRRYALSAVQLHGGESPGLCARLRNECLVIKAFSIASKVDLYATCDYGDACDSFLFDTRTNGFGGSGMQFDWHILQDYTGKVPFFLSGGIGPGDAGRIGAFSHPLLYGIDINSRFEVSAGYKDIESVKKFIEAIR